MCARWSASHRPRTLEITGFDALSVPAPILSTWEDCTAISILLPSCGQELAGDPGLPRAHTLNIVGSPCRAVPSGHRGVQPSTGLRCNASNHPRLIASDPRSASLDIQTHSADLPTDDMVLG